MGTELPVLYGIPNCDAVKRARAWLAEACIDYRFHDFKREGVPADAMQRWIAAAGWEAVLNRKGTTWRQLDAAAQAAVVDAPTATAVMQAHSSTVKRPVWEAGGAVLVGFDPRRDAALLRATL